MGKKVSAPSKILWTLRYNKASCPNGKLKNSTSTGRVCKKKPGRKKGI